MSTGVPIEIEYPGSDGKPMADKLERRAERLADLLRQQGIEPPANGSP